MPNWDFDNPSDEKMMRLDDTGYDLELDKDLLMEHILDNLNTTPIGQVLRTIAALPENRRGKVLDVRRQLTDGSYDLSGHLDDALERVLEDLTF
jgi:hypothetical protein